MGDTINDQENNEEQQQQEQKSNQNQQTQERPAGTAEGAAADPTSAEVKSLYEDLGIKAPVPTGATKGRPKTSDVRAKDAAKKGAGSTDSERKNGKDSDDEDKSKDASSSNKNGASGNQADSKSSKNKSDDEQVQDESGDADKGVRGAESRNEKDSERGREEDSNRGAGADESAEHDENGEAEGESDDEKNVKRPGKSNPEVERRMQRLAAERKEALERAEKAEKALQETTRKQEEARVAQEDPEYTVDDFRKVRDREGNIIDLDPERAELAWRRWKEGFEGRKAEREAKQNYASRVQEYSEKQQEQLIQQSVEAYDALAGLMDEYPELVSTSGKFDKDFAAEALPIIQESIEYLEGTEPGSKDANGEDVLPVIIGLKLHPKKILDALKNINNKKRALPLNGVNDNVESRSNVAVPHSRSSDPTVHAVNELYKDLGIDKRL